MELNGWVNVPNKINILIEYNNSLELHAYVSCAVYKRMDSNATWNSVGTQGMRPVRMLVLQNVTSVYNNMQSI